MSAGGTGTDFGGGQSQSAIRQGDTVSRMLTVDVNGLRDIAQVVRIAPVTRSGPAHISLGVVAHTVREDLAQARQLVRCEAHPAVDAGGNGS